MCFFKTIDGNLFKATIKGVNKQGQLILINEGGSENCYDEKTIIFKDFSNSH